MALTLTITSMLLLLALTLLGAWRGVPRGLLALLGTLIGALLADLWAPTWSTWLLQRFTFQSPETMLWTVTSLTFVLTVVLVGYGSSLLLPHSKARPVATPGGMGRRADMLALLGGAALGLFQGVLLLGFLLRYTSELLKSTAVTAAIQTSLLARLLHDGLGWAFLAPSLLVVGAALIRLIAAIVRRATERRKAAPPVPPIVEAPPVPAEPRSKA